MSQRIDDLTRIEEQIALFPATRYMGSKSKFLSEIWEASKDFEFDSVLDLFSGSGVVSYMYKSHGKRVISNDYMAMGATMTKALIENSRTTLSNTDVEMLLIDDGNCSNFVAETFKGLYFSDEDNHIIDVVRSNIPKLNNEYKQAIAMEALIRACVKKRPRGIFTYVGERYNDGRQDLKKSFREQFVDAVSCFNTAVFGNGKRNKSVNEDAMSLKVNADLVYIDPP